MPRPLCLGIPACEGGFQTRPRTTSRPLRKAKGGSTVIETIHPIISSTFTTRLDPHTLQRAFPTQHLTHLDHSFIFRFCRSSRWSCRSLHRRPFNHCAFDVEWRLLTIESRRLTVCFAQAVFTPPRSG